MVDEWNKNMAELFTPSWVSCLDESMSPWMNKYTCPGWMFVPRKPHPFGSTSALPAQLTPMAIASALQGSIAAMNVIHNIL